MRPAAQAALAQQQQGGNRLNPTMHPHSGEAARRQRPAPHEPPSSDIAVIQQMRGQLHHFICQGGDNDLRLPCTTYLPEPGGRMHRLVLVNSAGLRAAELTFVGFFGQQRPGVDAAVLEALDNELIEEFRHHPHLLSYSSLELPDRSWANLVLMSGPDGLARWAKGARHAYAANQIAPAFYSTIRLHNGVLHGGLAPAGALQFAQSRLFDFNMPAAPAWAARATCPSH